VWSWCTRRRLQTFIAHIMLDKKVVISLVTFCSAMGSSDSECKARARSKWEKARQVSFRVEWEVGLVRAKESRASCQLCTAQ